MANPTLFGVGTASKVSSGSLTPSFPASTQADDIAIAHAVCQEGETPATPSGWTLITSVNTAGQNTQNTWWWRRLAGGDSNPTFTGPTGGSMAQIYVVRGCITSGTPFDVNSANNGNSLTARMLGFTPTSAEALVMFLIGIESEFSACSVSGYTGTNPTFTEGYDSSNSLGSDWTGLAMASGNNDGSATGARDATVSATTTSYWGTLGLAFIPPGASGQPYVKRLGGIPGMGMRNVW